MSGSAPMDLGTVTSPEWLGQALGTRIAAVELVDRSRSLASKIRIRVRYADLAETFPTALFVKGFFTPEEAGFAWVGEPEALFYREIAPQVRARMPRCYYAATDPETRHGMMILDDLEDQGCRFFTPLDPSDADGAALALEQFARLHADTWADPRIARMELLVPTIETFTQYVTTEGLQELLDGPRGDALPDAIRSATRIREGIRALLTQAADGRPRCLVHGDAHLGNTYATPQGERGLLDFQIVRFAPWSWDVAYHIATALSVEDRRRSERALLAHYLDRLRAAGAPTPSWDEAFASYRAALIYGYNLWAITQRIAPPIIVEYVTRLGTAVADHDSFGAVGV